ncbi:hypothetical protein ACHWQZ_G015653 [Mnemiopsis leidyi]
MVAPSTGPGTLLDKVTEKLSSLVEANRMKPGVGEGRFRTAKRGNKMFLLAFKKQGDRLLETALRLDFFHPECYQPFKDDYDFTRISEPTPLSEAS